MQTDIVTLDQIRADVEFTGEPAPWKDDSGANGWRVTLWYRRRRMTVPFWTGSALGEPSAKDVLGCLFSDASIVESCADHFDMCDELGMTPSRETERTFSQMRAQTAKLRQLLGPDYDAIGEALREAGY
jgi:hypothetical protein